MTSTALNMIQSNITNDLHVPDSILGTADRLEQALVSGVHQRSADIGRVSPNGECRLPYALTIGALHSSWGGSQSYRYDI